MYFLQATVSNNYYLFISSKIHKLGHFVKYLQVFNFKKKSTYLCNYYKNVIYILISISDKIKNEFLEMTIFQKEQKIKKKTP